MELTDPPPARWSEPQAAHDSFRPGLSPYLHHLYDLRASRAEVPPRPEPDPGAGTDLPGQLEAALRDLIRQSFD